MSESYSRFCKKCGTRIHMRQMPAGQWVAFEGYDIVHTAQRCQDYRLGEINKQKLSYLGNQTANPYEEIGFGQFEGGVSNKQGLPITTQKPTPYYGKTQEKTGQKRGVSNSDWYTGCLWIIGILVFIQIISRCGK